MTHRNGPQPAPLALLRLIRAHFPVVRNLGIYNPRNVAGTNRPSAHAEGRAVDLGLSAAIPSEKWLGDRLFEILVRHGATLGLDHVIWNGRIWSQQRCGPRLYEGVHPHHDHIHVAFLESASQNTCFPVLLLELSVLRTGLEDLAVGKRSLA